MNKISITIAIIIIANFQAFCQAELEPSNNYFNTADVWTTYGNAAYSISPLGDKDIVKVTINPGEVLEVNCSGATNTVELDIRIFKQADTLVPIGTSILGSYSISNVTNQYIGVLPAGVYYILISDYGNNEITSSPYILGINVNLNDPFEWNNTFATAQTIPEDSSFNAMIYGKYEPLLIDQDRDFYKVTTTQNGVLELACSNITNTMELDISIFKQSDTLNPIFFTNMTSYSVSNVNSGINAILQQGTYYIMINDKNNDESSVTPFLFNIHLDTTDQFELNNNFASCPTVPINSNNTIALWGMSQSSVPTGLEDRDYFKLNSPECGILTVTANNIGGGSSTQQDIKFTVFQSDTLTQIGTGGGSCNATSQSKSFLVDSGVVYIRVEDNTTGSSSCTGYDLSNVPFNLNFSFSPLAKITSSIDTTCVGQSNNFTSSNDSVTNWQWSFLNATPISSTLQNPTNIVFNNQGLQTVTLTANNCSVDTFFVFVKPLTMIPTITTSGTQLTANAQAGSSYQWYLNGTTLTNDTNSTFNVTQNGTYKVCVTNLSSCGEACSDSIIFTNLSASNFFQESNILIYPNPSTSSFTIEIPNYKSTSIIITDILGNEVYKSTLKDRKNTINLGVNRGLYFARLETNEYKVIRKIVIK